LLDGAQRESPNRRSLNALGSILNNWGDLAARRGRNELAFERTERGLTMVEDSLKIEPASAPLRSTALSLHGTRANLLGTLGRHPEAVADRKRVIELNDDPARRAEFRLLHIIALISK